MFHKSYFDIPLDNKAPVIYVCLWPLQKLLCHQSARSSHS